MRGKRPNVCYTIDYLRNIPAYAGKTVTVDFLHSVLAEHPRVCGENTRVQYYIDNPPGTSPRMRGKPCRCT